MKLKEARLLGPYTLVTRRSSSLGWRGVERSRLVAIGESQDMTGEAKSRTDIRIPPVQQRLGRHAETHRKVAARIDAQLRPPRRPAPAGRPFR